MPLSRRNKQGLLSLLIVALVIAYIPRIISLFSAVEKPIITSEEAVTLHNEFVKKEKQLFQDKRKKAKKSRFKAPATKFDPNTYNVHDWVNLGLSRRQADVVIKFSANGLNSNKQLKKIFVIPEELYNLIKDSTFYPSHNIQDVEVEKSSSDKYIPQIVNLNNANIDELVALPGIGPFYAKKIIEYREELGGYKETSQLMELWKFDVHKFHKVKDFVIAEGEIQNKININTASAEELKAHPYIDYSVANSIIKMRGQKGSFKNIDEILESKLIDYELFDDIKHYIKVE